jgi:transposase
VERLRPHFPKVRGNARSDDRTVLSGIIHVKRNGLRWRDAPPVHGPCTVPGRGVTFDASLGDEPWASLSHGSAPTTEAVRRALRAGVNRA